MVNERRRLRKWLFMPVCGDEGDGGDPENVEQSIRFEMSNALCKVARKMS